MNWKLKAHGMAILSRLPGGRRLYHTLQSTLGTNRLDAQEGIRRGCEVVTLIEEVGQTVRDRTVVEVGTGWRPFLPLLLWLAGTRHVITLDVNPWLNKAYALETCRVIGENLDLVANLLHLDLTQLRNRYDQSLKCCETLQDLLDAASIEYHYPGDASATGLHENSVDFVSSSNVLEHVPPDILRAIHTESYRILKPNGLVVHRFNPGDHYAGFDRSITASNFLRYSEKQWRWYGGSGLSYHNRLRCLQHRDLLSSCGFAVLVDRTRVDQRAREAIQSGTLPIHPDFANYTAEQLAGDYMWLVGRKDMPANPNATGATSDR